MTAALSHCVSAECAVPARRAYAFLSDGLEVGRWALGSFEARKVGRDKRSCVVTLVAWRDASMSDARWERLVASHEVEIRMIQAQVGARKRRP